MTTNARLLSWCFPHSHIRSSRALDIYQARSQPEAFLFLNLAKDSPAMSSDPPPPPSSPLPKPLVLRGFQFDPVPSYRSDFDLYVAWYASAHSTSSLPAANRGDRYRSLLDHFRDDPNVIEDPSTGDIHFNYAMPDLVIPRVGMEWDGNFMTKVPGHNIDNYVQTVIWSCVKYFGMERVRQIREVDAVPPEPRRKLPVKEEKEDEEEKASGSREGSDAEEIAQTIEEEKSEGIADTIAEESTDLEKPELGLPK